jgi:hypothetical protein
MMLAYILEKISSWFEFSESSASSTDLDARLRALELR